MPIYTYHCKACDSTEDYLVARWGQKPTGCIRCNSSNLDREWSGQTFACASRSAAVTATGEVTQGQGESKVETIAQTPTGLAPGIHITESVTKDKRKCINVTRVQPNGKVDASVTGYKR